MTVQHQIERELTSLLAPDHLEVSNESHMHSVPPDSETHFRVVVSSTVFEGMRKVARHQRVYAALADLLAGPVHALALHTYTPAEWREQGGATPASPDCLGGSKAESAL